MTEADKPDDPAVVRKSDGAKSAARFMPLIISAAGVVFVAGSLLAYRFLAHRGSTHPSSDNGVPTGAASALSKPNSAFSMEAKSVLELEEALRGRGAEVSTPQEHGYRVLVPSQRARTLASRIPADAPPYALALKAIAENQLGDGRRLLAQTTKEGVPAGWRTALASSFLEVYAGRYEEAVRQAEAALKLRPDDPICLNQAGVALLNAGRVGDAAKLVARAIEIQDKAGAANSLSFADSMDTLATAVAAQGRTAEAVAHYQRALAIRTKVAGAETPANARTLNHLASLYDSTGRYRDAEPLYQRALTVARRNYGPKSAEAAVCLNNLAGLYAEQRQFGRAEPLFRQALDIQVKALGEQNQETAQTLNNLAGVYVERGKARQAEALFARVLNDQTKTSGVESPYAAQTMDNLASLYARERRFADAERLYKQELAIREKTLGKDHRDTAVTLNNLACLYTQMGRWNKANALFLRSIAIHEKSPAAADPEAANGCDNYAVLLRKEGRVAAALFYESRARRIRAAGRP